MQKGTAQPGEIRSLVHILPKNRLSTLQMKQVNGSWKLRLVLLATWPVSSAGGS
ncbi:hypothetical protein Q0F98_13715 [Paenibacillus amylolyticus]|nr:hypothetical protein Q0F98_13715 [Paenibacillus amylolyticus]